MLAETYCRCWVLVMRPNEERLWLLGVYSRNRLHVKCSQDDAILTSVSSLFRQCDRTWDITHSKHFSVFLCTSRKALEHALYIYHYHPFRQFIQTLTEFDVESFAFRNFWIIPFLSLPILLPLPQTVSLYIVPIPSVSTVICNHIYALIVLYPLCYLYAIIEVLCYSL